MSRKTTTLRFTKGKLTFKKLSAIQNHAAILFVQKRIQGKISSSISDEINRRKITDARTRNSRMFKTDDLHCGGPLHRILTIANQHRNDFNINESTQSTKHKLKKLYLGITTA